MFDDFIRQLAQAEPPPHCANPYRTGRPYADARRHNLHRYLHEMQQRRPFFMLVAEAPGYRGCRLSGIPFVSPHILREGLDELQMFGMRRGYHPIDEWPHVQREASATIMWQILIRETAVPLLWNVFPFHPHQPGQPQSNRTPKSSEIACGEPFLRQLYNQFEQPTLAAVGNKAANALQKWGLPFTKVRHPSHGGKTEFSAGVKKLISHCPG